MDRVNQIWNHPLYQNELNKLQLLEADREFCRHTPEHFLDVARLAYIRALEENAPVSKELIYCTALLHDIGPDSMKMVRLMMRPALLLPDRS